MSKQRADTLLVERGLAGSRAQAQALIMAGQVWRGEQRVDKAGERLPANVELTVRERARYVSRGGEKLHHAIQAFALEVAGLRCADIGASTGGFTDCLLQHGAAHVVAIDVGYGQLHPKLRNDPRVTVKERTNARHLRAADIDGAVDLVAIDASFISLAKLMGAAAAMLEGGGTLVALVKPQFEAGREAASKGRGVIRDEATRQAAIDGAIAAIEEAGFALVDQCESPVRGPKGNIEHLVHARSTQLPNSKNTAMPSG